MTDPVTTPPPTGQGLTERLARRLHTYVCGDPEVCCWTEEGERCADVDLSDMGAALAAEVAEEVAAAEVRALREFVAWVATHRAYNGSDFPHGQSLYNECINGELPKWAGDWLSADRLAAHTDGGQS